MEVERVPLVGLVGLASLYRRADGSPWPNGAATAWLRPAQVAELRAAGVEVGQPELLTADQVEAGWAALAALCPRGVVDRDGLAEIDALLHRMDCRGGLSALEILDHLVARGLVGRPRGPHLRGRRDARVRLTPDLIAWLDAQPGSRSNVVERLILAAMTGDQGPVDPAT